MLQITEQRLIKAFHDRLGGAIRDALANPDVIEVIVNASGQVWLDTLRHGRVRAESKLHPAAGEAIIRLVAHHIGETVSEDRPLVAGIIPLTGERFQGVLPPLAKAPTFTIRKRPTVIFRLDDYVADGVANASCLDLIRAALTERKNILVSGGTSSGKTTLLSALLAEPVIADDRVILIEDTVELQCAAEDKVQLLTKRTEPKVTIRDLVQTTLRLRPDRIVVGEIRDGAAALEMLKAWNTGHDGGLGTVHANSGSDALHRLEDLLSEVTGQVPHRLIGQAIDLVVHIRRRPEGRRIEEIIAVDGYEQGVYRTRDLTLPAEVISAQPSPSPERISSS